jgi:hypothetical protein
LEKQQKHENLRPTMMKEENAFDLPKRSRNSVCPGNIGRLEKCGGPSPLTDDHTSRQTGFDHASCSAVVAKKKLKKRVSVAYWHTSAGVSLKHAESSSD